MIGIRSVTYTLPQKCAKPQLEKIVRISRKWAAFSSAIRTQRIVFPPFTKPADCKAFAEISKLCDMSDIRWFNVPIDPWKADDRAALFRFAEEILSEYGRSFVNVLTYREGKADQDILEQSCALIKKTAAISENGKDNFRLGLSVNIEPNGAFFPFTYSGGEEGFSIALELTQEITALCAQYPAISVGELREIIHKELTAQILPLNDFAKKVAAENGVRFHGFDFSLAPIIADDGSIVPIIQRLGVYNFGKTGTMFATAFLTDLVKSFGKQFPSVGFSGVMYSLLEDLELCMIHNQRGISLDDLIKVSTMCGCGVDMVPVPYDISMHELKTICTEVYAISTRLKKPLGIRILPIPHTKKSQIAYTNLSDDADFIANTKILDPDINIMENLGEDFSFYLYG